MSTHLKPVGNTYLESINPATYEVIGKVAITPANEVPGIVEGAQKAQEAWWQMGLEKRLSHLKKVRDLIVARKEGIAKLTTKEMGMNIGLSLATVDRAADYMDWALENAEKYLSPETTYETDDEINQIVREPWGVAACISPWNFPISNFVWACWQPLIAGNAVVFKNSEETQLTAVEIEKIFADAGMPANVFNVIYGAAETAEALTSSDINLICFTGSTRVGQLLYAKAAEKFIPALLEMGGSDPGIIFADAALAKIIPDVYAGRFTNCGQICRSLKRLIVDETIADKVVSELVAMTKSAIVGDPLNEATTMGPLAAERQLVLLKEQVEEARAKGATILCGGKEPEGLNGAFYEPTIITDVTPDMRIWHEEVFGPVLAVRTFKTYKEAIELANDTIYGLGSNVFTEDKALAQKAIGDIKAGMVRVNRTQYGRPCNPFGGTKLSGMGRENGALGFHDVTQAKIVACEK